MRNIILLSILTIVFAGCNFNTTSTNNEYDRKDAEKITNKFYHYLDMNDFKKAETLFSEKFFEVTDRDQLQKIFEKTVEDCGTLTNFELQDWNTLVVKGSNPKSEYVLLYKVSRKKKDTMERVSMMKENDSIKIVGYHLTYSMLDE